jgi:hypothetical protein
MSTDGYPSGRMFRTDIFSIMFRSYYLRGYLFSIKVIPQAVLRFFFFGTAARGTLQDVKRERPMEFGY